VYLVGFIIRKCQIKICIILFANYLFRRLCVLPVDEGYCNVLIEAAGRFMSGHRCLLRLFSTVFGRPVCEIYLEEMQNEDVLSKNG
jgi:hypothetical protein